MEVAKAWHWVPGIESGVPIACHVLAVADQGQLIRLEQYLPWPANWTMGHPPTQPVHQRRPWDLGSRRWNGKNIFQKSIEHKKKKSRKFNQKAIFYLQKCIAINVPPTVHFMIKVLWHWLAKYVLYLGLKIL